VRNHNLAIRAYHKHNCLIDIFCIVEGHAKFVFIDDRPESETFKNLQIVNVSSAKPSIICVPAGVFHGWKAPAGTILVSMASELYMGRDKTGDLDEVRIAWDWIGESIWDTEYK
jgi:dTDP-4-dehydrorhamnose 3,5-epimerase-like enzyme